jgi:translation initiation factor IF-1
MAKQEDKIEFEGVIDEAHANGFFTVKLDQGHEVLGYPAGKMRRYNIRILPGDRVKIELSAYDLTRGRIIYRFR